MFKLTGKDYKSQEEKKRKINSGSCIYTREATGNFCLYSSLRYTEKISDGISFGISFGSSLRGDKAMSTFTMDFITSVYIILYYFFVFFLIKWLLF